MNHWGAVMREGWQRDIYQDSYMQISLRCSNLAMLLQPLGKLAPLLIIDVLWGRLPSESGNEARKSP